MCERQVFTASKAYALSGLQHHRSARVGADGRLRLDYIRAAWMCPGISRKNNTFFLSFHAQVTTPGAPHKVRNAPL